MARVVMKKVVKKVLKIAALGFVLIILSIGVWIGWVVYTLPDARLIATYRPEEASEVLDRNGVVLTHLIGDEFRVWAPLSEISDHLQIAVIAAEDDTFFRHEGINYKAAWEALKEDLKKKRYARGGSTITQQLVKNVFLTKEKTITRKLKEWILTRRVEEILPKRRILELYLNEVEWGPGVYGAEAASRFYFDKHARELSVAEGAILAAMLVNPDRFDPVRHSRRLRHRQQLILDLMRVDRLLTREEYEQSLLTPVLFRHEKIGPQFPVMEESCALRLFRSALIGFGKDVRLFRTGHAIRTTLDAGFQKYIEDQIAQWAGGSNPSGPDRSSQAPPGLLIMEEEGTIRAVVCVRGGEEGAGAVEWLKGQEPDAPWDYRIVESRRMAWRSLVVRS